MPYRCQCQPGVIPVSDTSPTAGVMSPPSLGGDSDTKGHGTRMMKLPVSLPLRPESRVEHGTSGCALLLLTWMIDSCYFLLMIRHQAEDRSV